MSLAIPTIVGLSLRPNPAYSRGDSDLSGRCSKAFQIASHPALRGLNLGLNLRTTSTKWGTMIPVNWYMSIMLIAGVVTFVYGLATGDIKTILGSFLFTGIGGVVYFVYRR